MSYGGGDGGEYNGFGCGGNYDGTIISGYRNKGPMVVKNQNIETKVVDMVEVSESMMDIMKEQILVVVTVMVVETKIILEIIVTTVIELK